MYHLGCALRVGVYIFVVQEHLMGKNVFNLKAVRSGIVYPITPVVLFHCSI